jgi:TPR repeat protein
MPDWQSAQPASVAGQEDDWTASAVAATPPPWLPPAPEGERVAPAPEASASAGSAASGSAASETPARPMPAQAAPEPEPSPAGEEPITQRLTNRELQARGEALLAEQPARGAEAIARAAEGGYAPAQARLGELHLEGLGVSRNITEAMRWFRRSAAQGDPEGYYGMGLMYERGLTVPQDAETAEAWYRRAAAKGSQRAGARLQRLAGGES